MMACAAGAVRCSSPETRRVRDGGPGADIGNKTVTNTPVANPQASDTTLWPGRATAPVERLARGEILPPAGVASAKAANPRASARPPAPPP